MSLKRYFTPKPLTELANEANNSHDLERTLTAFQLILMGVGAIVGAGIFVLVGIGASHAGPAVVLSFVLGAMACACAALCYAELASAIPLSGSAYSYTYATLGELPAWLVSGCIILSYVLSAASVASGWSGYLVSLLGSYGIIIPPEWCHSTGHIIQLADGTTVTGIINLPAVAIVALLACIVYRGANASAMLNTIIVIIKLSVLFAFITLGLIYITPSNWTPFVPANTGTFGVFGFSGIVSGAAAVFLAYMGFDTVATAAQEAKNPQRDLPIGILGSLGISTLFYVLVAGVLTGLVHYTQLIGSSEPLAIAVKTMQMPWFSILIKIGAVAGLASVILVLLYASVRVLYTVTHDGLLPMGLAKINRKYHTPHILTIIVSVVVALLGSMIQLDNLVFLSSFGTLLTYIIVCFSTLYMRRKFPNLPRGFKCPWVPVVPLLGITLFGVILYGLPNHIFGYAFIWILFILVIYFGYGRRNSHLQKEISEGKVHESTIVN
jgi:APA family basic amino acid/polyamine antiporter